MPMGWSHPTFCPLGGYFAVSVCAGLTEPFVRSDELAFVDMDCSGLHSSSNHAAESCMRQRQWFFQQSASCVLGSGSSQDRSCSITSLRAWLLAAFMESCVRS